MKAETIIEKLKHGIQPVVRIATDYFEQFEQYDLNFIVQVIGYHYEDGCIGFTCIIPDEWLAYNKRMAKQILCNDGSYNIYNFKRKNELLFVEPNDELSFSEVDVASAYLFAEWQNQGNGQTYIQYLESQLLNKKRNESN